MDKQHFAIDRKHPRIETKIPCRVGRPDADFCDAIILNLSVGGLMLECNRETYSSLIPPEQSTPGQVSDVPVIVKFSLSPIGRRAMNMQLTAMVIHSERLAQDRFHIGIQFTGVSKANMNRLENHIDQVNAVSNDSSMHT